MESSFLELRCKEVINVVNGKKLGRIIDIVFDLRTGCIKGFVVPDSHKTSFFKSPQTIFIAYHQICKIGTDTILVEVYGNHDNTPCCALNEPSKK